MRILCTICARGGSKGVPGKNLRLLAGKPLIAHTIALARRMPLFDRVVVSTDDERIARVARKAGADVPFLRPRRLATDKAPKLPVVCHALKTVEGQEGRRYDLVVDLDPTSPLRAPEDIRGAVRTLLKTKADVVFSVCEARKNPYFNMVELGPKGAARLCKTLRKAPARRQDAPRVYEMNASIYVYRADKLPGLRRVVSPNARVWVMPRERSVDIDSEEDFRAVERLATCFSRRRP